MKEQEPEILDDQKEQYPRRENWGLQGMPPIYFEVLDRHILSKNKGFERQLMWIKGHHPHLGKLHYGWSGPETIVEKSIVRAARQFEVR